MGQEGGGILLRAPGSMVRRKGWHNLSCSSLSESKWITSELHPLDLKLDSTGSHWSCLFPVWVSSCVQAAWRILLWFGVTMEADLSGLSGPLSPPRTELAVAIATAGNNWTKAAAEEGPYTEGSWRLHWWQADLVFSQVTSNSFFITWLLKLLWCLYERSSKPLLD